MKKLILTLVVVLGCIFQSNAQNYDSAIGLRLGYPTSISYKQYLNDSHAFEIFGGFRGNTGYTIFNLSASYQIHNDIKAVEGLNWYYGGGAGLYYYSHKSDLVDPSTAITVSGYLGLEYTFANLPISITTDWVPTFVIGGDYGGFGAVGGSLGVRYILAR